jgi:hypothetical protein
LLPGLTTGAKRKKREIDKAITDKKREERKNFSHQLLITPEQNGRSQHRQAALSGQEARHGGLHGDEGEQRSGRTGDFGQDPQIGEDNYREIAVGEHFSASPNY